MNYIVGNDYIKIYDKNDFNPTHILECGQVFCYEKTEDGYVVFPQDQLAFITEKEDFYLINTKNPSFFVNFFDLNTNYSEIKKSLKNFKILEKPIEFGYGIRILNQDLFETLISFILSANNNIKRIKLILNNIRKNLGEKLYEDIYSFPSYEKLKQCDEQFFKKMGAGYRSQYLYKVLRQIDLNFLYGLKNQTTPQLRVNLLKLYGVGPKVADCILLFGYHKGDVFPVDTWIEQMYLQYYKAEHNREKIRQVLTDQFKDLSGFAQQYLFYYQRSQ